MNKNQSMSKKNLLKLHHPNRYQLEMKCECLDDALDHDHKARTIWDCVQAMNTNPCFNHLKTYTSCAGRKATNPEVLFGLWLLAFTDNIVSSREITDLVENHDAYRWMAGGVPVNHNMLCGFRSLNAMVFEDLLTSSLALLQSHNLLSDKDFAQDGTRIQSAAGRSSGKREETLLKYKEEARQKLRDLGKSGGNRAKDLNHRKDAIRLAAAKQRKEKLDLAIEELKKAQDSKLNSQRASKEKLKEDAKQIRISPTDPEARKMKMGNGGYSLAYNAQVVTGTTSRAIYAISPFNSSDQGKVPRMMTQTMARLRAVNAGNPENWIADAAYSNVFDIEFTHEFLPSCNAVFASKPQKGVDPKKKRKTDGPGMEKWRNSLETDEFTNVYTKRCQTVELSNARLKSQGLSRFRLAGLVKVKGEALLGAIAHNISLFIGLVRIGEVTV